MCAVDLSLALPLLGLLVIMWASERRKNRTFVNLLDATYMILDEIVFLTRQPDIANLQGRVTHLERSFVETPDAWVGELAKNVRGTPPYASRTAGPKVHDPRNELSAIRDEVDAELGIPQDTSTAYQMKPDAEPQHTTPRESCLACKEAEARDAQRQLDGQAIEHAIEYGLPIPDAGFRWERQKDGAYLKVRMYGTVDQFPDGTPLTYMPGLWRQADGTPLSPEESAQVDADIDRFGTGDNKVIQ